MLSFPNPILRFDLITGSTYMKRSNFFAPHQLAQRFATPVRYIERSEMHRESTRAGDLGLAAR